MSYEKLIEGAERPEVQQFKRKTVESHFAALGEAERQAEQIRLGAAVGLANRRCGTS